MTITVEATDDAGRWNAACAASGQPATPFHTLTFLRLVAPMIDHTLTALIVRSDGTDVGVVPWLVFRRGPFGIVNRTPFPYVGPLVAPELVLPTLRALRAWARRSRAVVEEHQFAPGTSIAQPAAVSAGFELSHDRTFVLDTARPEEQLWAGMTSRTRSLVRKAERGGITIAESSSAHRTLATIEAQIYTRKELPAPYGPPFPPTLDQLRRDGLDAHWASASRDGEELATLLTLVAGPRSGIWVGGVFPEHRTSAANTALVWDAIRWAHEHGVTAFDFVGLPDPGIETFKKQFGGTLHTYPVLRRVAPGWRAVQRAAVRVGELQRGVRRSALRASRMRAAAPRGTSAQ